MVELVPVSIASWLFKLLGAMTQGAPVLGCGDAQAVNTGSGVPLKLMPIISACCTFFRCVQALAVMDSASAGFGTSLTTPLPAP